MKSIMLMISILMLCYCDSPRDIDDSPPIASFPHLESGQTVSEIVSIEVEVEVKDQSEIEKVEFIIDDSLFFTDFIPPYEYFWNAIPYMDRSIHVIEAIVYDISGNFTEVTVSLIVDNSDSYPSPVELNPIIYLNGEFNLVWSKSIDHDFFSYYLYESIHENMNDAILIHATSDIEDTTFVIDGVGLEEKKYYQIITSDFYGLSIISSIVSGSSFAKIAFVSERTGDRELYIMEMDGSNQTRLTQALGHDDSPQFSPDGSQIVFKSQRDGNPEVYLMDVDGNNQFNLTNFAGSDWSPQFSPDGTQILFESTREGDNEIFIINTDGSNLVNLTDNNYLDRSPQYSPDGSKIVFLSIRDGFSGVYVMNNDGSEKTKVTTHIGQEFEPSFSPDNSRIIFTSDQNGSRGIYSSNIDGSNQTQLTDGINSPGFPIYSPEGTHILFSSQRGGYSDIYIMESDGSNQIMLVEDTWSGVYSFASDIDRISFVHFWLTEKKGINIMNTDGSNQIRLSTGNNFDYSPQFQPRL